MTRSDDDPVTLATAAADFDIPLAALRAEAARGRLTVYKLGKRLYTKRSHIEELNREWYAKRNIEPKGSGIYVVGFLSYVKIGWSTDLPKRIATLRCALPDTLTVYATFQCAKENERILHRRFRAHKTRGEWFRHEGAIADWVKRKCPL